MTLLSSRCAILLLVSLSTVLCATRLSATRIPVKHKEGTSHGFIVLRSQEGQILATGDMIQTVEHEYLTSELVLHFKDGSVYDEVTTFSQEHDFRLVSDRVRQQGPSFPATLDARIDAGNGDVAITSEKDGKSKSEQHHLPIPEDASNGMMPILLKNISPRDPETTISMVATSSKPRIIKLKIHSEGEHPFSASGQHLEATHYVIHTDIGGVAGAVAPVIGKQPADIHLWIVRGKAPAFVKFTGQLYDGGPVWNIELADVHWENDPSAHDQQ